MSKIIACLRLMRPANIVTAVADILAGFAITFAMVHRGNWNEINFPVLLSLILSTIGLYGGGVVMNDIADYETDKVERPERPIPGGKISRSAGAVLGSALLLIGVLSALHVSAQSGIIALTIAMLAVFYDFIGKHHHVIGPVNMGLCRGGNLLLGMSSSMLIIENYYLIALLPIIYITAITLISRGEVAGGNKVAIRYATFMYSFVVGAIALISFYFFSGRYFFPTLGLTLLFAILIFRPLFIAHQNPDQINIRNAVKAGVISLIVMDAAIATSFTGWQYSLTMLILLPFSFLLAKVFAVT